MGVMGALKTFDEANMVVSQYICSGSIQSICRVTFPLTLRSDLLDILPVSAKSTLRRVLQNQDLLRWVHTTHFSGGYTFIRWLHISQVGIKHLKQCGHLGEFILKRIGYI